VIFTPNAAKAAQAAGVTYTENYVIVPRMPERALVEPSAPEPDAKLAALLMSTDLKEVQTEQSVPEAKMLKGGAPGKGAVMLLTRAVKPLRLTIPYSFSQTAASTGIVNSVTVLQVDSNTTEWAAAIALYTQFKVHGGVVKYFLVSPSQAQPSGGLSPDNAFTMCYDPANSTALSSVRQGCESTYHDLRVPSYTTNTAATGPNPGGTAVWGYHSANGKPYTLKFQCKGAMQIVSGAVNETPGMWQACASSGSNPGQGFIKSYGQFATNTGNYTAVCGFIFVDVEFRNRV
jgi:hypothetical protein